MQDSKRELDFKIFKDSITTEIEEFLTFPHSKKQKWYLAFLNETEGTARSEDVDGGRRTGCSLWTKSYKRRKGRTSVLKVLSMEKICCIFDFQWKDIVAPLYHHFDTKKVVLQTSVGAPPKDRLEELKTLDAK